MISYHLFFSQEERVDVQPEAKWRGPDIQSCFAVTWEISVTWLECTSLSRSLAACAHDQLADMVQVPNLGSDCCEERDVGERAGRSLGWAPCPPFLGSCISAMVSRLVLVGLHHSRACAWPCISLIQTPALTHGLTSWCNPRRASSLWALTTGILA